MDSEHCTILLIEDNPVQVELVRQALSEAPKGAFELESVDRLASGLERLAVGGIDAVLLDLGLPDSQGLETFRGVRSHAPQVPVVVLTTLDNEEVAIQAVKEGAQDYLIKRYVATKRRLSSAVSYAIARTREKAMRESATRFRTMIYNNVDGMLIVDSHGTVRFINPAALSLFGVGAEELLDQPFGFPIVEEKATEVDIVCAHGEPAVAEMRPAAMEWQGEPVHLVSLRDVTERKRVLEELDRLRRQQLKMKDQFISHVSHELRSPLAAVYQFVTILLDGLAGEVTSQQQEHLEVILRNALHLKTMIDDLLDVSRAETGKLTVEARYLTVAEPIRESVESCSAAASAKNIALSADVGDDLPPAYADGQRVRQIVVNLINNAVKFTPENGSVTVRAQAFDKDDGFLCISVTDSGCGISEEDCKRIFEQMYQADRDSDAGRQGLGLGLYISSELISCQGGQIWVESRLGGGSTFSFTLPVFSLARRLEPILAEKDLRGSPVALITVDVSSIEDRSLGKLEQAALDEAWEIVDRCIIRAMDVVLPRMPGRDTGEAFHVAARTDSDGAEALVVRIRQQLAGCEALKAAGLTVAVSSITMDVTPLPDDATLEDTAKHIAGKIEDLVMAPA